MSTKSTAVLGPQVLPGLPLIGIGSSYIEETSPAVKRIQSDADVVAWQQSTAHRTIILFLARLCESAVGKGTKVWVKNDAKDAALKSVEAILDLLEELQSWTREIEPLKSPQRFGNLAFRTWGLRIEEKSMTLHQNLLPKHLHPFIPELQAYFLGGFGSWIRLDYGSGHELSFLAWLCFLVRLSFFSYREEDELVAATEERLALEVIPKYLEVVWGLQDRYGLEPAGSHGVWGLDDFQFIPYAIGAAQLRNQIDYLPSAISSPSHKPQAKLPIDQLLQFIPSSTTFSTSRNNSSSQSTPPFANLYTTSIARIHTLKRGPFAEHSPILYDVSTTVASWVKVHGGMMKMWEAECLGKRPVIQHFPFGGLGFVWEGEIRSAKDEESNSEPLQHNNRVIPVTSAPWKNVSSTLPSTGAPWMQGGPSMPATAAPWARSTQPNMANMASTGSAAAASSPFGIISRPSVPPRSRKD